MHTLINLHTLRIILTWLLLGLSFSAWAQNAGVVEFSRGVGFAQLQGQIPRTLGKGLSLGEGDRLTTSAGATAIIKLNDGTRMTLRPNSEMVVQQYQYSQGAASNSMIMQLLRGGFRAITGLISKGAPNAAQIRTVTATVGIRGTDFDARLCGADCRAESASVSEKARPNTIAASAKLILAQGDIHALDFSGSKRVMVAGASVYSGDTIATGADAKGVLIFRDDSRLTLGTNTKFKVDSFVFDEKTPGEGNFLISLLRGSMRALTGIIGKTNKRNVSFKTPTATVGIRGTGLDLDCSEEENCKFFTWLGSIDVMRMGQTGIQTLQAGQGLWVSKTQSSPITASTLDNMQRPDKVPVNVPQLFSSGTASADDEGLFVYVREGHIEVTSTTQQTLHLGRGETGFAGNDGRTGRPAVTPLFIQFDKVPMPNQANPMLYSVLGEVSQPSSNQCR
jgi:hypothetical protein